MLTCACDPDSPLLSCSSSTHSFDDQMSRTQNVAHRARPSEIGLFLSSEDYMTAICTMHPQSQTPLHPQSIPYISSHDCGQRFSLPSSISVAERKCLAKDKAIPVSTILFSQILAQTLFLITLRNSGDTLWCLAGTVRVCINV